jgi:CRISPR-associated protein Cas1
MIDRVLDISEEPARLSIRNGLLVVESGGAERAAIPCAELASVVIGHRQVTLTQSVLTELAKAGALLVTCDGKFAPASMMLPLDAHHAQAERFRRQAALPLPRKKRLWQSIVRAKIRAQASVLEVVFGNDEGLRVLVSRVGSGDSGNVEARAARRYWARLFEEGNFRRRDEDDPRNHLLNYGYAVLRSLTARAVCGVGLHPSFSLYHTNVHNPFGLADDLMEPFRPIVDLTVCRLGWAGLDRESKARLIGALLARYIVEEEERTLPDILNGVAQSVAGVVMGDRTGIWLPSLQPAGTQQE